MRLTTSPPSCAECHEIWEPKPPRTLWATPGLLRDALPLPLPLLQHTSCYRFQASLVRQQGAYSCTNICRKLSARSSAAENSSLCNIYVVDIVQTKYTEEYITVSGVPRNFFRRGRGLQQIQLRTENRENRDVGAVAPYSGVLKVAVIWYKKFHFIW